MTNIVMMCMIYHLNSDISEWKWENPVFKAGIRVVTLQGKGPEHTIDKSSLATVSVIGQVDSKYIICKSLDGASSSFDVVDTSSVAPPITCHWSLHSSSQACFSLWINMQQTSECGSRDCRKRQPL